MSTSIDFDTGFFGRLRAAAGDEWTGYVSHPFVRALGTGSLPEACFRRFLVQDYLFLTQFARAYGLSVYKSTNLADIRAAAAGVEAVLAEIPLHVGYCAGWGLDEASMAAEPEAPETMTYTRYVSDVGHTGDILDLTVALMPCVAGYAEVGQLLLADPATVLDGSPYGAWLRNYDSEEYKTSVRTALDKLEDLSRRYGGEARFESLSRIFLTATRLETAFWQMGLDAARPEPR
ncbi:thiaminase (transcriptional activator TenA) [Faunimonas pinastri]|uniref:Thiaminase (Transcriptional activator TenA) n=1 Tax=Faunimonas pinastri TaxID=1855383 RepID=A0A1H9M122_9HYPH|nr:TenA family protein [Faunimonas pinastri]SER17155.1 thiaminase (transcriptional activator TenA) [Faunimonas pinastri]